jgi:hypothetical protein
MYDPTERNVEQDVKKFVDMFERAQVGEIAPIQSRSPKHVLLVLDNTSQDELSIGIGRHLKKWFECTVSVFDARENVESNEIAQQAATHFDGTVLPKGSGDSFQQILDAVEASGCDFLVVPCPYGRDFEAIGPDSMGTVIDVLLARSPVPLLVVRKPYRAKEGLFNRVVLVLIGENKAASAAAAWASGFVSHCGSVQLLLILEEEFYVNVKKLMQEIAPDVEISPDSLSNALLKTHLHLHLGLQKAATEAGFQYDLAVYREDEPEAHAFEEEAQHPLLVLALERTDHSSEGHVHDRIRRSLNPLLIVPID